MIDGVIVGAGAAVMTGVGATGAAGVGAVVAAAAAGLGGASSSLVTGVAVAWPGILTGAFSNEGSGFRGTNLGIGGGSSFFLGGLILAISISCLLFQDDEKVIFLKTKDFDASIG